MERAPRKQQALPDPQRRRLLLAAGGVGLLGLGTGCEWTMKRWLTRHDNSEFEPASYSFEDGEECLLTASAIEGPYFIDAGAVRRDIREGKPGAELLLRLKVVEAELCTPVRDAVVEVWHCDALGNYSGYPDAPPDRLPAVRPGESVPPSGPLRFLRGIQVSDADGLVEFQTIFPGWYSPRVQHVHVKVLVNERAALTTQLYFPQDLIDEIQQREPYRLRPPSPYTNRNDFVIHDSGGADGGWLRMSARGGFHIGSLTLGVPGPPA